MSMYPTTKKVLSKLKNSCVDPLIAKAMPNPKPIFPIGPLSYPNARGFPRETNQVCHGFLKKSTKG